MFRRIADAVTDFLWPPRCILCGAPVRKGVKVCDECLTSLPVCEKYVLAPDARRAALYCVRAPFYYVGCARKGVLSLKFESVRECADFFARRMAQLSLPTGANDRPVVTAVPLSKRRLRRRGYNQSELIARQYALYMGLEYRELLTKTVNNPKQSLIRDIECRRRNVRGCYAGTGEVTSGDVILVDDVYSSGATMNECARILRENGAVRVVGIAACTAYNRKRAKDDASE